MPGPSDSVHRYSAIHRVAYWGIQSIEGVSHFGVRFTLFKAFQQPSSDTPFLFIARFVLEEPEYMGGIVFYIADQRTYIRGAES